MKNKRIVVKKGNKTLEVTEKAFCVVYKDLGFRPVETKKKGSKAKEEAEK